MFDWARGSCLQRLVDAGIDRAQWHGETAAWLKTWSHPWFVGLGAFRKGLRVLDVGSAEPVVASFLNRTYGVEAHALDLPAASAGSSVFGFSEEVVRKYANVSMHVGLAGDDTLPAEHFDIVLTISAIEHSYDAANAMDPARPLRHIEALRDMCRMLKPGGVLMMNWDMYLQGVNHMRGWDHLVDFWLLEKCGMRLADESRITRSHRYMFDHPDTLFFHHNEMLGFGHGNTFRGTSINAVWRKPGRETEIRFDIAADLKPAYYPEGETRIVRPEPQTLLNTDEMEARFRGYRSKIDAAFGRRPNASVQPPGAWAWTRGE